MKIFLILTFLAFSQYAEPLPTGERTEQILQKTQELDLKEITEYLGGSQLVFFTKTSIFLEPNARASAITYVNFCADGRYTVNHDGSYSIVNDDGSYAKGGASGTYFGNWKVIEFDGSPYLKMTTENGESNYYPIDVAKLIAGSWRQGQTQYAIERNSVICN